MTTIYVCPSVHACNLDYYTFSVSFITQDVILEPVFNLNQSMHPPSNLLLCRRWLT